MMMIENLGNESTISIKPMNLWFEIVTEKWWFGPGLVYTRITSVITNSLLEISGATILPKINTHRLFKTQISYGKGNDITHCQVGRLVWYTIGFQAGAEIHYVNTRLNGYVSMGVYITMFKLKWMRLRSADTSSTAPIVKSHKKLWHVTTSIQNLSLTASDPI